MGVISNIFLPLAIAFIMFSLGLGLKISDFTRIASQPKDIFVGLLSQIIILPIIAFIAKPLPRAFPNNAISGFTLNLRCIPPIFSL